jgi:hypothetical protein
MLIPWPRIRTVHVMDDGREQGEYLPRVVPQTKAWLSARADAQQFRVKFSGRSSHYMVFVQGSTISLSVSEGHLQGRVPPVWVSRIAQLVSSCAMSRCVIWRPSIFGVLVTTEITSLEFAKVHIQGPVHAETGLLIVRVSTFTWAAVWDVEWPRLAALSVTECGYIGVRSDVRLRDEQVGTHTLQNDAHALARLDAQIQDAAGRGPRTEAVGAALQG